MFRAPHLIFFPVENVPASQVCGCLESKDKYRLESGLISYLRGPTAPLPLGESPARQPHPHADGGDTVSRGRLQLKPLPRQAVTHKLQTLWSTLADGRKMSLSPNLATVRFSAWLPRQKNISGSIPEELTRLKTSTWPLLEELICNEGGRRYKETHTGRIKDPEMLHSGFIQLRFDLSFFISEPTHNTGS